MSAMCASYKAILCLMRRLCKDDRINALVAGVLSSLSILLDSQSRRVMMALIFFSRALVRLEYYNMIIGRIRKYARKKRNYREV